MEHRSKKVSAGIKFTERNFVTLRPKRFSFHVFLPILVPLCFQTDQFSFSDDCFSPSRRRPPARDLFNTSCILISQQHYERRDFFSIIPIRQLLFAATLKDRSTFLARSARCTSSERRGENWGRTKFRYWRRARRTTDAAAEYFVKFPLAHTNSGIHGHGSHSGP